jgi:hypothetical protein
VQRQRGPQANGTRNAQARTTEHPYKRPPPTNVFTAAGRDVLAEVVFVVLDGVVTARGVEEYKRTTRRLCSMSYFSLVVEFKAAAAASVVMASHCGTARGNAA